MSDEFFPQVFVGMDGVVQGAGSEEFFVAAYAARKYWNTALDSQNCEIGFLVHGDASMPQNPSHGKEAEQDIG